MTFSIDVEPSVETVCEVSVLPQPTRSAADKTAPIIAVVAVFFIIDTIPFKLSYFPFWHNVIVTLPMLIPKA